MSQAAGSHFADAPTRQAAAGFGMLVFLASESLLFVALLALYAAGYVLHGAGFTAGAAHNLGWVGLGGTLVLLGSSGAVAMAVTTTEEGRSGARRLLLVAVLLGALFLLGKGYEYFDHIRQGILPGGHGVFFKAHGAVGLVQFVNLYWLTTGLHALHVIVGLVLLACGMCWCSRAETAGRVELVGWYWHFVDLLWLFLWPLFYTVGGA